MPIPYEILIRGEKGAFKGAHVVDVPGGDARAIKSEDWPTVASAINLATLARVDVLEQTRVDKDAEIAAKLAAKDEEVAAKDAEIATKNSLIAEATKVILDPNISDEDTVKALKTKIDEQTLPGKIAAAEAKVQAAQDELDALKKI